MLETNTMSRLHREVLASLLQKRVLVDKEEVILIGIKMKGDQTLSVIQQKVRQMVYEFSC